MKPKGNFPPAILETIRTEKILGIRAGTDSAHRIIGIWVVVVEGRIFVRSYGMKPRSWWRTLLEDPRGIITVGEKEITVRAVQTRSEKVKDLVREARICENDTPQAQPCAFLFPPPSGGDKSSPAAGCGWGGFNI